MKKRLAALLLGMMLCAVGASAAAQGEGMVSQSSCSIVKSGDYYLVYCFAQVYNTSDNVICLDSGLLSLMNGEQLLATSDVSQLWPYFLSPGETGYLFDIVPFEPNEDGVVVPAVTGISYDNRYLTIEKEHANLPLDANAEIVIDERTGEMAVVCEMTNSTEMEAYNPIVSFGLYTEGGAMIYADGMTLQQVGIPAGETMLLKFPVDSMFVEQWQMYNAMPAQAHVKAVFRRDED